jgi:hypothetical protein
MTIQFRPEQEHVIDQAIRAGLIERADEVVEVGLETLRSRLVARGTSGTLSRQEAVRRMQEFGEKYRLTLGEPVTRDLLHEGHRY